MIENKNVELKIYKKEWNFWLLPHLIISDLNLSNIPLTSLPNNLKVGGYLDLTGTPITSLPNNLKIGRDLYLTNTPISKKYTQEEIRQMIPGVEGDIYY